MARKITLNQRPADFKRKVEIPMLDGGEVAEVEFHFKYRTRTEHAKLIDEHAELVKKKADIRQDGDFSFERFVGQSLEDDADMIVQMATGWDLDDAFNKENVVELLNKYGGSGQNITAAYRSAIVEGRLGN